MKNFDYAKKYHYLVKYLLIAFPILLILLSLISYNSQFNDVMTLLKSYCVEFRSINFNSWWNNLLNLFELNTITNDLLYIVLTLPLYILWVYIFDILLDVFAVIPRIAHKMLSKIGGDY